MSKNCFLVNTFLSDTPCICVLVIILYTLILEQFPKIASQNLLPNSISTYHPQSNLCDN